MTPLAKVLVIQSSVQLISQMCFSAFIRNSRPNSSDIFGLHACEELLPGVYAAAEDRLQVFAVCFRLGTLLSYKISHEESFFA